jgi:hypothetical protein
MIDLYKYINESIFDEEDIMSKIDNIATIDKWYNKLSNKTTYREAFKDFWKEIAKKCKPVQLAKVKSRCSYIVFETRTYDSIMGTSKNEYIELIEPYNNGDKFTKIYIDGTFVEGTERGDVKAFGGGDVYSNIDRVLPRKSKFNNFDERKIYEVTPDIEWVIPLIKKLREKLYI